MKIQVNDRTTLSQPRNKSVEAYKAWIMEIAHRLTTEQTTIQFTEAEWIANWKEYWKESPAAWRSTKSYPRPSDETRSVVTRK